MLPEAKPLLTCERDARRALGEASRGLAYHRRVYLRAWEVRRRLEEEGEGVPDQKGKLTARPTLRWVFQLFCEIRAMPVTWLRLVLLEGRVAVLNPKPHHERVVRLLGVERYYLLE